MSQESKIEVIQRLRPRYQRAGREHKRLILDQVCELCGYERKYATKVLNHGPSAPPGKRPGPKPTYGQQEQSVLSAIWKAAEQPCSKRLKPVLSLWLPHYAKHFGSLSPETEQKLLAISPATIDRLLAPIRSQEPVRRLSGTRPGTLLKTHIPVRSGPWDESQPGFLEADSVAHCGESMGGSFIWSVTYTDICTGWTAVRAVWNRGAEGVVEQTRLIEQQLPFPVLGFDCDNGAEFLNWHLVKYLTQRPEPVQFTRSRPYHKNDNAHVEQKNWTHVRQLLGYERFEDRGLVELINDLYAHEWYLLQNFFCSSMKLKSKERIKSRQIKKHDEAQTPYQRLLQWGPLSAERREQLKTTCESLDPFVLAQGVERKLKRIFQRHRRSQLSKAG